MRWLDARRTVAVTVLVAALAGCGTTPATRFYTLLRPADAAPATEADTASPAFAIDVLPVAVPEQVDVPQLVLRRGSGELSLVETRQWAAPLGRELRAALSDRLRRTLAVADVHRITAVAGMPVWRVKVDIARFDSALGRYALLDAAWSIGDDRGPVRIACATRAIEPAAGDYEALVAAHQRAVLRLADQIAVGVGLLQSGAAARCPG